MRNMSTTTAQRRVVLTNPKSGQLTTRPGAQTLNDRFTKLIRSTNGGAEPVQNTRINNTRRVAQAQRAVNRASVVAAKRTGTTINTARKIAAGGRTRGASRGGATAPTTTQIRGARGGRARGVSRGGGQANSRRGNGNGRRKKDGKNSKESLDKEMEEYRKKDPNYPNYLKEQLDSELDAYMDTRGEENKAPTINNDSTKTDEKKD